MLDGVQIAPILLVRSLLQAVLDGFDALVDLAPATIGSLREPFPAEHAHEDNHLRPRTSMTYVYIYII